MWGVRGWALSHARPPVLAACGQGPLPTGCGCGGYGRGDPFPTPQRALLRAGFARCRGDTRVPGGGGASCLGVGRSGSGALPCPTAHPCVSLGVVLWLPCALSSVRCCAALWWSGALASCCSFGLCRFWRPVLWWVPVCCAVSFGVLRCGDALRCSVCRVLCCCALWVFSYVPWCYAAAPLARCCVVPCWRACVLLLCCALLCCFVPVCLLAVLAACPPPLVRTVPCAVWCRRAVLPFPLVVLRCRAAVFRAACCGVLSRLALLWTAPRCAVPFVLRSGLLLRAVPRLRSCHPAALFALWFAAWFCGASPYAVV